MDPTAQNVGIGGALFLSALYMFLKFKPWERKNGNGHTEDKLTERRLRELEDGVKDLRRIDHDIVRPSLRWHDQQIVDLGGERSESLKR